MKIRFFMHPLHRRLQLVFLALITSFTAIPSTTVSAASPCKDLSIVFARGSGSEVERSADYLAFQAALTSDLSTYYPKLSYAFHDLGNTPSATTRFRYPSVSIEDPLVVLGAKVHIDGTSSAYRSSVNAGVLELRQHIASTLATCPQTKFILAGYSQGAQVISTTLSQGAIPPESLVYAATFGDPKLYLPEGYSPNPLQQPPACQGQNLSNYRVDAPDCRTDEGILGPTNPYQLNQYHDKLGAWCNQADPICGSYFDFSRITTPVSYEGGDSNIFTNLLYSHLAYQTDGSYQAASNLIIHRLGSHFPTTTTPSAHDVVFLFDSTGSMRPLIDRYRQEALRLATEVTDQGGRIALYEYRDLDDPFLPHQLCDFSCSLSEFETQLSNLSPDGGGDTPESALSAALTAMNQLSWQSGARKSLVLLTDASYHNPDRDGTTSAQVVQLSREIDPVNFYVVTPDPAAYSDLATLTGGHAFSSLADLSLSTDHIITNQPTDYTPENTSRPTLSDLHYQLSDHAINLNFSTSSDTYLTLALVNDQIVGFLNEPKLYLSYSTTEDIKISLLPVNSLGRRGVALTLDLSAAELAANHAHQSIPRAPNSGFGPAPQSI